MIKHNNNVILETNVANSSLNNKSEDKKLFGLWVFLMSDCIMFAVLFSIYTIISSDIDMNILSKKMFNLYFVLLETFLLLLSSLSCSLIVVFMNQKKIKMLYFYLIITFFLGITFLFLEMYEFYSLILDNLGPDKHALFSIFFALVGTHGIHIFFGLITILAILYQIFKLGLTDVIHTRVLCFSIFWHFLDIVWICVFTFVYLSGCI